MQQITADQLAATPGAHIIDVREPDEYRAGHVPDATNIPLAQLGDRLREIPTGAPVHVICQSGGRSARATEALNAAGFDAVDVTGGTSAWQAAGHPVDAA
ncbi:MULTISPECIES: rhodanese-like domain-containing protein [unclassified Curtobacterium]|uniref:rhodanese-like domain-containing protein n=1 Tax=unclassified Curtobacterium TaxID=257496 RepID=UPI0008DC6962|nr:MULTISPECIES: rhodanese-like domain-containing protein [unclassified Curtobacterium]WIA96783.1 rhodanese-like domain-containing protein [Curtobacterium sp. MCBA15_004]WIB00085.1 rhodanese-like domain-containing protein [Curtobacterium sp. MCBA15_012]